MKVRIWPEWPARWKRRFGGSGHIKGCHNYWGFGCLKWRRGYCDLLNRDRLCGEFSTMVTNKEDLVVEIHINRFVCWFSGSDIIIRARHLVFRIVRSLWNLTGTSAAVLPMCLSNFKAIRQFKVPISWLRDFTRSYGKTSFRILRRGPECFIGGARQNAGGASISTLKPQQNGRIYHKCTISASN